MNTDRLRQLMQESLDDMLSPEEARELERALENEPEEVVQYNKLRYVDSLLSRAPHERAPQRLALTIMARVAKMIEEQRMQEEARPEISGATMQIAMAAVTVAALPLLVAAGWLLLNAKSTPETLEAIIERIAALFILVIDVMKIMLKEVEETFAEDPEVALALLALMPVALLIIVRKVLGIDDGEQQG